MITKIPKEIENKIEVSEIGIEINPNSTLNEVADIIEKLVFENKYVYMGYSILPEEEVKSNLEFIKDIPQFKSAVLEKGDIIIIWERYLDTGDIRYLELCFRDKSERDKYVCVSFKMKKAKK